MSGAASEAGAGVEHQPGTGFGKLVGHPTGNAKDVGSSPTMQSMCAKPSAAAATDRATASPDDA
jgi:hypothetical protein